MQVYLTFYAAADNDPPGSTDIAYPNRRHAEAGGAGTYADPLTLATDPRELPVGALVYLPYLRKYLVMEDQCEVCATEWGRSRRPHVDVWVSDTDDRAVLACEEQLTPSGLVTIEINPPPGRTVDPRPLFADGTCRAAE